MPTVTAPSDDEVQNAMTAALDSPLAMRDYARDSGINPVTVAIKRGALEYAGDANWWLPPVAGEDGEDVYSSVNLVGVNDNILARYCESIAASIQFPVNTAYAHGLGVVASAMTHNFRYSYHGEEKPVNLYVVTAQPPSTGKSGVNTKLTQPIRQAVHEENEYNKAARISAQIKVNDLLKEIEKKSKDSAHPNEIMQLSTELAAAEAELAEVAFYRYGLTDATPEALEEVAGKQSGVFSIVSDEADAINIILGNVYGDKKANMGLFLSAWDGDYFSSTRITRAGHEGPVFGSISVIAQDESINSILEAGQSGRGVSERFLILRERNMLGRRDFSEYRPVDESLKEAYSRTVGDIFRSDKKTLHLGREAYKELMQHKQDLEPLMADDGRYANNFLRGVVGKAEKQVIKIACVLHALKEWAPGAGRSLEISGETMLDAIVIFSQLMQTYTAAADSKGFVGNNSELARLIEYLQSRIEKKKKLWLTVSQLRDGIKNSKPFSGQPGLTKHLREKLLPELEERNYIAIDPNSDVVYLNPRLR